MKELAHAHFNDIYFDYIYSTIPKVTKKTVGQFGSDLQKRPFLARACTLSQHYTYSTTSCYILLIRTVVPSCAEGIVLP